MPMYNLIEYSDNYSKISGSLWKYYSDEPALTNAGALADFTGNIASFKFKQKITGSAGDDGTEAVQIMVPLKYLNNFRRTLEMPLINCETNLILTWSANCVISEAAAYQDTTFAITDTNLYVPVVTLSTQDNARLLQQLKSEFKHTINRNKYHSKAKPQNAPNPYLDFLINQSFQGVNRLFVLPFNVPDNRTGHSRYYLPTAKVENYNVMIAEKNFPKITNGQGDDYRTGCLLDYNYLIKYYKMIAIDLSKQQALEANPKAIQRINITGNINGNDIRFIFFHY